MAVFAFLGLEKDSSPWLFDRDLQLCMLVPEQESLCEQVTCTIDHASEKLCFDEEQLLKSVCAGGAPSRSFSCSLVCVCISPTSSAFPQDSRTKIGD